MLSARNDHAETESSAASSEDRVVSRVVIAGFAYLRRAVRGCVSTQVELSSVRGQRQQVDGRSTAGGDGAKVALSKSACNEGGECDGGLHLERLLETRASVRVEVLQVERILVIRAETWWDDGEQRGRLPAYLY